MSRRTILRVASLLNLIACAPAPHDASADASASEKEAAEPQAKECEQWGPIGVPSAAGTFALRSYGYGELGTYLLGTADSVVGISPSGERIPCTVRDKYGCYNEAGLVTVEATLGSQTWSWPALCPYYEDAVQLNLDDAKPCVASGTIVLEGDLLGVDTARSTPRVTLEGPWQIFETSVDPFLDRDQKTYGLLPAIECAVEEGHYRCPTLGLRNTAQHAVLAGGTRTQISLPVASCSVQTTRLDLECPATPRGFYVIVPEPLYWWGNHGPMSRFTVSASYEGEAPFSCISEPERAYDGAREDAWLCPAAGGEPWGRGRYDVVALRDSRVSYEGSVTDPFDGCGGAASITLERARSPRACTSGSTCP